MFMMLMRSGTLMDGDYGLGMRGHCGHPDIMSLIARRVFMTGDVVTAYGGALGYQRMGGGPHRSHVRRIPGCDWILDGKTASVMLSCTPQAGDTDRTTHLRTVLGYTPLPDQDPSLSGPSGCSRCANISPHSRRLLDFTGLGFMVNSPASGCSRTKSNVKSISCSIGTDVDGVYYPEYSFYVATRRIKIEEGFLVDYVASKGNPDYQFQCLDDTH
jgi:hypothetical protein